MTKAAHDAAANRKKELVRILKVAEMLLDKGEEVETLIDRMQGESEEAATVQEQPFSPSISFERMHPPLHHPDSTPSTLENPLSRDSFNIFQSANHPVYSQQTTFSDISGLSTSFGQVSGNFGTQDLPYSDETMNVTYPYCDNVPMNITSQQFPISDNETGQPNSFPPTTSWTNQNLQLTGYADDNAEHSWSYSGLDLPYFSAAPG